MGKKGLTSLFLVALLQVSCDCGQLEPGGQPDSDGAEEATGWDQGFDTLYDPGLEDYRDQGQIEDFRDQNLPEGCQPPAGVWTYFTIDGTDWPRNERIFYESPSPSRSRAQRPKDPRPIRSK